MTDNEKTEAEETYLNERFGGGVLGVSPEQVHQFVESQEANTVGAGFDGGQSRSDAPTSYPGDTDQSTGQSDPSGGDLLKHVDEHIAEHGVADVMAEGLEHGAGYGLGGPGTIALSTVVGMESDQPETPEQRRQKEELEAMKASEEREREAQKAREEAAREQWERDHPGMHDEPDASVPDATTQ